MSKPIIQIEKIGKRYQIGAERERYLSLRDQVARKFSRNGHGANGDARDFWALKDVSFDVQPGETVGIIGRNGAGKSTLLKTLSQIRTPTEGKITMRGRVASLLGLALLPALLIIAVLSALGLGLFLAVLNIKYGSAVVPLPI